jgi:hypothetical protein
MSKKAWRRLSTRFRVTRRFPLIQLRLLRRTCSFVRRPSFCYVDPVKLRIGRDYVFLTPLVPRVFDWGRSRDLEDVGGGYSRLPSVDTSPTMLTPLAAFLSANKTSRSREKGWLTLLLESHPLFLDLSVVRANREEHSLSKEVQGTDHCAKS